MSEPKLEWNPAEQGQELSVNGLIKARIYTYATSSTCEVQIAGCFFRFPNEVEAKKWLARVVVSEEFSLYEEVVRAGAILYEVTKRANEAPATIELCVFFGKITAACDILCALKDAGLPMPDPNEEAHPLEEPQDLLS